MDDTEWSDWSENWYEDADLYSQCFHFEHGYDGIDAVVHLELDYEKMFENTFISTQQTSAPLCNVDIDQFDNCYDKIDTLIEYDSIKYNDIKDYKMYKNQNFGSMKTDLNGERVNWLSIKWIQVRKDRAQSIFVNYGFDPNEFKEIMLFTNKGKSKEKAQKAPQKAYNKKLPISAAKTADLFSLVSSGTIPREYEPYYQSLPSSKSVKDKLPMPSVSEVKMTWKLN